ncbi:MAG: hypothetical protein V1872_07395 [bacterium]
MKTIKQVLRVPKNHEIRIKIPQEVPENEIAEVILVIKKNRNSFKQKIDQLKESMNDNLFLNDLQDISDDFKFIDIEGWD